jgi:hypothetical protein
LEVFLESHGVEMYCLGEDLLKDVKSLRDRFNLGNDISTLKYFFNSLNLDLYFVIIAEEIIEHDYYLCEHTGFNASSITILKYDGIYHASLAEDRYPIELVIRDYFFKLVGDRVDEITGIYQDALIYP